MKTAWLGFERRVAVRFLREGRMQTVLIMVGVAAGVAVITYISVLIGALQASTVAKTLGSQAHVVLQPLEDVVIPAAEPSSGQARMSDVQPRAQRLRSVANWQALLPPSRCR
jgi:lipoprotein-releasing system permease protein